MKRLFVSIFCMQMIFFGAHAQKPNHRAGQILVYLSNQTTIGQLTLDCQAKYNQRTQLFTQVETLSEDFGMYRLFFDESQYDENEIFELVDTQRGVIATQFNHIAIARGLTPNDPLWNNQWNIRKSQIDQVWDSTTGGVNALGDSIVVAVAEVGGFNASHPDLKQNIYRNRKEIANNSKDDDKNGYIDDVLGWNPMTENGQMPADDNAHGAGVLGIIGANGGNKLGVAGINWNVRMMLFPEVVDEATSIKCYTYVIRMRDAYNRTRGKEGAFIVALNYSAGIEDESASKAPLWCKMFDELGKVGILAVTATSNATKKNIEIKGDIPSQCTSNYLTVVTNTGRQDNLVGACSSKSVDLSGPGGETVGGATIEAAFTTRRDSYSEFAGTSAATPHVTGSIALLYSYPNRDFAEAAITKPAQTALFVRDAILNGVDKATALTGCTVTGGRLNTFRSYQLLQQAVGETEIKNVVLAPNLVSKDGSIKVFLKTNGGSAAKSLFVYDAMGRLVAESSLKSELFDTNPTVLLNVENYANGVYFLSILNNSGKFDTHRFIICR